MTMFGIARAEISKSTWIVVDAINHCSDLPIEFPRDHGEQHELALQFKKKSSADFDCCVGAVDGILIWIQSPSAKDSEDSAVGIRKFLCGRKHKYGLNCQAICDARGKFLDMSMVMPGSLSDALAFELSTIYQQLEEGLLAPGLCLFGDNAYINSSYMATPFSSVSDGSKDAYNFYHSQLRINIECAFGRFVLSDASLLFASVTAARSRARRLMWHWAISSSISLIITLNDAIKFSVVAAARRNNISLFESTREEILDSMYRIFPIWTRVFSAASSRRDASVLLSAKSRTAAANSSSPAGRAIKELAGLERELERETLGADAASAAATSSSSRCNVLCKS
jgi:hypothetical protein